MELLMMARYSTTSSKQREKTMGSCHFILILSLPTSCSNALSIYITVVDPFKLRHIESSVSGRKSSKAIAWNNNVHYKVIPK